MAAVRVQKQKKPHVFYLDAETREDPVLRHLFPDYAINGDPDDTIQGRIFRNLFETIGAPEFTGMSIEEAETHLVSFLTPKGAVGVVFEETDAMLGGRITRNSYKHLPTQLIQRIEESATKAYISAACDDDAVKNAIQDIGTDDEAFKVFVCHPDVIKTSEPPSEIRRKQECLFTFKNIFYTAYPVDDGKKNKYYILQKNKEKKYTIIQNAIKRTYANLNEDTVAATTDTGVERDPGEVFADELRAFGVSIEDDMFTMNDHFVTSMESLTTGYLLERGGLLSQYPEMILPGDVDLPIVVACEKLGLLASAVIEQGDIDIIHSDLKALDVHSGTTGALLGDITKVPKYFDVSKPFNVHSKHTYIYSRARGESTIGIKMTLLSGKRL